MKALSIVPITYEGSDSFFSFFFLNFIFKLYIIVLVLPNIKMNPPQVYMCSSWDLCGTLFFKIYERSLSFCYQLTSLLL